MKLQSRLFWIGLIAVAASFAAGMYLSALDILKANLEKPSTILIASFVFVYLVFFATILSNERLRSRFIQTVFRFNRTIGNLIESLIGVGGVTFSIERPITRNDLRDIIEWQNYTRNFGESSILSSETQNEVLGMVRDGIREGIKEELSDTFRTKRSSYAENSDNSQRDPFVILELSYAQIRNASSTVTIRGFVNLLIGIAFAIGALYFLKETVAAINPERVKEMTSSEVTFIVSTRVSLSLIITLIAYFFLSLYKKSLEDVKYYQNELTFIGSRLAAMATALRPSANATLKSLVPLLMDADRNRRGNTPTTAAGDLDYGRLLFALLEKGITSK